MGHLTALDWSIMAAYCVVTVGMGIVLERRASQSIEDYLIGGRKIPWWILGVAGTASFFDMTGTMIVTSFLYMLGPRGLYIEFRGGAVLVLVFYLLWAGKWHRRSQCLTSAEWMVFRFGDGPGGRFAQFAQVLSVLANTIGMLAYLIKGGGLFLSLFLPWSPAVCAFGMCAVATAYTAMSGFYGVVFTDLFQTVCILGAVVAISAMAVSKVAGEGDLAEAAAQVTGNANWMDSAPGWHTTMPPGYEPYQFLFAFMMFYLVRNVLYGMGGGNDPKYFGARSDRECGLLSLLWVALMSVRWPMMMGFAVLGIYMVRDAFPDPAVVAQAVALVKAHAPQIAQPQWAALVFDIASRPAQHAPELIAGLQQLLGASWPEKLQLLSFHGTVDPERILPAVLMTEVFPGFRGLMITALVAAAMSTFDATVNMTTGLITRDVYQKYLRAGAATRELIGVSWAVSILLVAVSFAFAYSVDSINDIWGWIIMGLGGGLMMPTVLRLYWWRFNGGGFAIGTIVGLAAAVVQRALYPGAGELTQFLVVGAIGLAATVAGAYLTPPTDAAVLQRFYGMTRPFGLWGPFKRRLGAEARRALDREHRSELLAVPFVLVWQVTLFLLPMQLLIAAWSDAAVTAVLFVIGGTGGYLLWFRRLPPAAA